jgi:RNA polymerase sigma factor FliA
LLQKGSNSIDLVLWRRLRERNEKEAEAELVEQYLPLVDFVSRKIWNGLPYMVERDDLIGFGHFGLLDAIQKFDYERGLKFETYAIWRIRGAILDGLRGADTLPRSVREKAKKVDEAYLLLEQRNNRVASDKEVCDYLGIQEKELMQIFSDSAFANPLSLDEPIQDEEDHSSVRQSFVKDERALDPQKELNAAIEKKLLADSLDHLSEKERLIVTLYYYEELNITEIAEIMSLSPSRISQLHSRAIGKIRSYLTRTDIG